MTAPFCSGILAVNRAADIPDRSRVSRLFLLAPAVRIRSSSAHTWLSVSRIYLLSKPLLPPFELVRYDQLEGPVALQRKNESLISADLEQP